MKESEKTPEIKHPNYYYKPQDDICYSNVAAVYKNWFSLNLYNSFSTILNILSFHS